RATRGGEAAGTGGLQGTVGAGRGTGDAALNAFMPALPRMAAYLDTPSHQRTIHLRSRDEPQLSAPVSIPFIRGVRSTFPRAKPEPRHGLVERTREVPRHRGARNHRADTSRYPGEQARNGSTGTAGTTGTASRPRGRGGQAQGRIADR